MDERALAEAARRLRRARAVVVFTGAGMSRDSGIPTFRDAEGLWARFRPEEWATEAAFRRDPERVWAWYAERHRRLREAAPHPGYEALVELEARVPALTIVTQNVDGLHRRAGSGEVIELHGSLERARCSAPACGYEMPFPADAPTPPPCPRCGARLRPAVVWFGETLPPEAVERAWARTRACDVLLAVGTSGTVWPAAELPWLARRHGATVIEINPEPTELTSAAHLVLRAPAAAGLPALVRQAWDRAPAEPGSSNSEP